jgi:hypothetical protein
MTLIEHEWMFTESKAGRRIFAAEKAGSKKQIRGAP